jgi:ribosomal protein S1
MSEEAPVGGLITRVERFGMLVDIGLEHPGFVDPVYVDDSDFYAPGQDVTVHVMFFDERKRQYILRPVGQTPLADRLRAKGYRV